jgi:hypothetical protein
MELKIARFPGIQWHIIDIIINRLKMKSFSQQFPPKVLKILLM